jgi:TonB family protein
MKAIARSVLLAAGLLAATPHSCIQAQGDETISDKDINVIEYETPGYPALALQSRIQGIVVVRARLDAVGKVIEATALSGSQYLLPEAVANAKKFQFQPNSQKAVVVVYHFKLSQGRCKFPSGFSELEARNLVTITACPRSIEP